MKQKLFLLLSFLTFSHISFSQSLDEIDIDPNAIIVENDIFKVRYSERLEQPLEIWYRVQCPYGDASRSGMDFYKVSGIKTSDNDDYVNNEWDKGHLAPAAAFNCDKETLKKTFSYLNCALQHEGLNRGPWKELEEFERGLAKISDDVLVHIIVVFSELPSTVPGGATIPSAFIKEITFNGIVYSFLFPNENVSGQDWGTFNMCSPND